MEYSLVNNPPPYYNIVMVKVAGVGTLRIDLRALRKAAGNMTQEELAERSGLRQGSISKMEQDDGDVERIALETLIRLSHALGLDSPMEMFTWEEGPRYRKWARET